MVVSMNPEELATLAIINMMKPFARPDGLERAGLGAYSAANPTIHSLVQKGLLKVRKNGDIIADRDKALAVLKQYTVPDAYRKHLYNSWIYFKSADARENPASPLLPWWS